MDAEKKLGFRRENVYLLEGDITKPDLGLSPLILDELSEKINHCIHLAALYDLTVPYMPAYSCNVLGTGNVLAFAKKCKNIIRFCYYSTAYVSGFKKGRILEEDLNSPSRFRNYYEQTKHEAESIVRASRKELPITIIRPGVIVGDSSSGETMKFDGPYFIMQFINRFAPIPIPYIGKSSSKIHLVPVDFIIKASVFLMHESRTESKTYHLVSPDSPTIHEAYTLICKELTGKSPSWYLPKKIAERVLSYPLFSKWLGVPYETLSYFSHEAEYDTAQLVKDLDGSGITCPTFEQYVEKMVRYYKLNATDLSLKRY
jgi:thioester reductase-like protein